MVEELLTPQGKGDKHGDSGLGVFVEDKGDAAHFGHPGDNLGLSLDFSSAMHVF